MNVDFMWLISIIYCQQHSKTTEKDSNWSDYIQKNYEEIGNFLLDIPGIKAKQE